MSQSPNIDSVSLSPIPGPRSEPNKNQRPTASPTTTPSPTASPTASPTPSPTASTASTASISPRLSQRRLFEEEEEEVRPRIEHLLSLRFVMAFIWVVLIQTTLSTALIISGVTTFIGSFVKCGGIVVILAMFAVPLAYAICPEIVRNFKFCSLAPVIADGLYKLDYFANRLKRLVCTKLNLKW